MKIFRNRTVIGVLCILLALIICFGVTPLFSRSASEKTEIVRVTMDIKEGDEITAEMVQTVEVGAYNLPQNLMTDKKEVVGKYATADLAAGDYILSSKLSAVPAAENAYLYNLDGTKQAISVTIKSFATGLSGKLESGDIVTVIVADYQGKGETAIPPELQYVEVISVTASSGYDANTGEVVDEKELPSTVTLLVTTEQAKVLAELEQDSELHLALVYVGDITKLNGAELPPVDIICGGSPCQDLSVAGARAGLSGARSGLFMEQVRLVKEMRNADEQRGRAGHAVRPRYMLWENVPGAFSSGTPKGEDFRIVLEEIVRVKCGSVYVPGPYPWPWQSAGRILLGTDFSLAWRCLDAQYWGVAQRRKRIFLVADFAGRTADKILFIPEGMLGDPAPSF